MASEKPELTRAGTMEVTAQLGQQFLERNLTEWKKPHLMDHFEEGEDGEENNKTDGHNDKPEANNVDSAAPTPAKCTTMVGTAKEAEKILEKTGKPDEDAHTRGQQKKIEELQSEEPAPKKPKLSRDSTMAVTAKEGKELVGDEKLGDTRGETKARRGRRSGGASKSSTMNKAIEEAKELYGDIDVTGGRSLRKRPDPPKPSPKRAGTMQKTAKEGKEFLKGTPSKGRGRGRPKKSTRKDEDEEEEEKEEEEKEEEESKEEKEDSKDEEKEDEKEQKSEDKAAEKKEETPEDDKSEDKPTEEAMSD